MNLIFDKMEKHMLDSCVDLFIDTFTKEPWYDVYESRQQVVDFFRNHMESCNFVGYIATLDDQVVALNLGMKKPWIQGLEYYIDEFCVSDKHQRLGIGSWFLHKIEEDIKLQGLNAIILHTEKGFPSHKFYEKNGFEVLKNMIVLAK